MSVNHLLAINGLSGVIGWRWLQTRSALVVDIGHVSWAVDVFAYAVKSRDCGDPAEADLVHHSPNTL